METSMKNRVALIVGASDEVGAAIALQLAATGANLALVGAPGKLEALAERLADIGGRPLLIDLDSADPALIANCVQQTLAHFKRIDVLVNNASDATGKSLHTLTAADVSTTIGTALTTPFHFMREVVPQMQQNGFGRVVNVSDINYLGLPNQANAAAARAGLFGLTRSVALETARDSVTVNTVVKGDIANAAMSDAEKEKLTNGIPVKRLGTANDVARAVCFFASDASKYLTGQTLFVCGGKSAYFSMSI